jgi:hypothetical protein
LQKYGFARAAGFEEQHVEVTQAIREFQPMGNRVDARRGATFRGLRVSRSTMQ